MKLYKALLRLYPASFRAEYEDEMRAVFERGRPCGAGPERVLIVGQAMSVSRFILETVKA